MRTIASANWTNKGMAVAIDRLVFGDFWWPMRMFKHLEIRYIYVSNVLAGCVAYDFPTVNVREVKRIAIKPRFQRNGVGSDLLTYIKQEAATEKNTHITAFIDERNLEACKFFARNGFQSRLAKRKSDTVDSIHFRYSVK